MVNIRRFIDRVSGMDASSSNTLIMPVQEARMLRDEIVKLLADTVEKLQAEKTKEEVIQINVSGGHW
jgi:hypothetical protein